jgi:hypothetical protein
MEGCGYGEITVEKKREGAMGQKKTLIFDI